MPDALQEEMVIADYDRDSIHTLPLSVIPLDSPALAKARFIKNVRLETRVELFREKGGGSGQISIDEIPAFFGGGSESLDRDIALLKKLAKQPSFDPYSMRMGLRRAGVNVLDVAALQLSPAKKAELLPLMQKITRPLVAYLYGGKMTDADNIEELIKLVARPDTDQILKRIRNMSDSLGVSRDRLPDVLEEFGDMFLALSYYRGYFNNALPTVNSMLDWMRDIKDTPALRNPGPKKLFAQTEGILVRVSNSVTQRFNSFDRNTEIDWDDVTVDTFSAVQDLILKHQRSLAEVLCGLMVKMCEWENRFPNGGGAPDKRVDFVATELRPGLDTIWAAERRAPNFDNLAS